MTTQTIDDDNPKKANSFFLTKLIVVVVILIPVISSSVPVAFTNEFLPKLRVIGLKMTADIVELFVLRPVNEEKHGDARTDSEESSDSDENREALALVSERKERCGRSEITT